MLASQICDILERDYLELDLPLDSTSDVWPVVVLGAGINGVAVARELVLNRVHVWLVGTDDVADGTTAYSSRLIHVGLRYFEYGELSLVRESLSERTRLLRLTPQFVRPLRLFIPIRNRSGGLAAAIPDSGLLTAGVRL